MNDELKSHLDPSLFFDIIIDELCPKFIRNSNNKTKQCLSPIYFENMHYLKSCLKGDFITYIQPKQYKNENYFNKIFKKNEKIKIEKEIHLMMYNNNNGKFVNGKKELMFLIYKNYKIIIQNVITDDFFNEIQQDNNITEIIYDYNVVDTRIFTLKQIKIIDFKTDPRYDLKNNIDFFQTCYNYLMNETYNHPLTIKFCNWKFKLNNKINGKTIYRMIQDLNMKNIKVWLDHTTEQINQIIKTIDNVNREKIL